MRSRSDGEIAGRGIPREVARVPSERREDRVASSRDFLEVLGATVFIGYETKKRNTETSGSTAVPNRTCPEKYDETSIVLSSSVIAMNIHQHFQQ